MRSNIRTAGRAPWPGRGADGVAARRRGLRLPGVALGLLGVTWRLRLVFALFVEARKPRRTPRSGSSATASAPSFVALFAQLGGGIYTKAADVGADLVGKVEAGIPEDDPRNPAVIADLVGDNVGDCAGRGADLFESHRRREHRRDDPRRRCCDVAGGSRQARGVGPLPARSSSRSASSARSSASWCARAPEGSRATRWRTLELRLLRDVGARHSGVLVFASSALVLHARPCTSTGGRSVIAACIGIADVIAFVFITQYYTGTATARCASIAEASQTGPATNIIAGIAVGMEYDRAAGASRSASRSSRATTLGTRAASCTHGVASIGGICSAQRSRRWACSRRAGYILAMDIFGPITDNAGGIVEMSQPAGVGARQDRRLDSVGNTTKALTKGYAIGSAALAAFLLFSAYPRRGAASYSGGRRRWPRRICRSRVVFVGGLLGAMLVFSFSSLAMRPSARPRQSMITEVRRQFKERPGHHEGTEEPDYARVRRHRRPSARCRRWSLPGALVVPFPIVVGMVFKHRRPRRPSGRGAADGRHDRRHPDGGLPEQRRRRLGQRQEVHRGGRLNGGKRWASARRTRRRSSATRSAIRSRTRRARRCTSLIKLLSTITLVLAPLFLALHP